MIYLQYVISLAGYNFRVPKQQTKWAYLKDLPNLPNQNTQTKKSYNENKRQSTPTNSLLGWAEDEWMAVHGSFNIYVISS